MSMETRNYKCTVCKKVFSSTQKLQGHIKIFHEGKVSEFRSYKLGSPTLLANNLNYLAVEVPNLPHLMPVEWSEAWDAIHTAPNPHRFSRRFFKSLCKAAVLHLTVRTHLVPCTEKTCNQILVGGLHPRRGKRLFPSHWCLYRGDIDYCPGYPGVRYKVDCGYNLPSFNYPVAHLYEGQPLGRDNCIATKVVVLDYSRPEKFYCVSRLAARSVRKNINSHYDTYATSVQDRGGNSHADA